VSITDLLGTIQIPYECPIMNLLGRLQVPYECSIMDLLRKHLMGIQSLTWKTSSTLRVFDYGLTRENL